MLDLSFYRLYLESIQFEHPYMGLFVLGVIPVALIWAWWRKNLRDPVLEYGTRHLVLVDSKLPSQLAGYFVLAGLISLVVLGSMAATMPYRPLGAVSIPAGSLRVAILVDTSISMGAENNRGDRERFGATSCALVEGQCGSRIEIARLLLRNEILPALEHNEVGLVVFAQDPITRSQLTTDFRPLYQMAGSWHWLDVGSALGKGSDLARGLSASLDVLKHEPLEPGRQTIDEILYMGDGGNDSKSEELSKAIDAIKTAGVAVIAVGLGSTEESPIPLYDDDDKPIFEPDGKRAYQKKEHGTQIALTARNDDFLRDGLVKAVNGRPDQYIPVVPGQPLNINWPTTLAGSKATIGKQYLYPIAVWAMLAIIAVIVLGYIVSQFLALHQEKRRLRARG